MKLKDGSEGYCSGNCIIGLIHLEAIYNLDISDRLHFKGGKLYFDDKEVAVNTYGEVLFSITGWIRDDCGVWRNDRLGVKSALASSAFLETFYLGEYGLYDVSYREVVDVGANVGDTAIYFAKRGAKRVYAFEPLPSAYKVALENIQINGVEDKITLFNAGVSSRDGTAKVPSDVNFDESIVFSTLNNTSGDVEVPIYSLTKIVNEVVEHPYLLKMDCEGCEADVILNSKTEVLEKFEKVVFEHHAYDTSVKAEKLIEKLTQAGFECTLKEVGPRDSKNDLGLVYCEKKQ